jgi:multidrug efflux pump subunit AcrB
MLWLWKFFLERRQFSYVLIATLIVAGFFVLGKIPKENFPNVDLATVEVITALPGASAEDMETLVTDKLEDQINNVANIDTMTSNSSDGVSTIVVQFTSKADTNQSVQDVRDAVSRAIADLPSDATTPQVQKFDFSSQPVLLVSVLSDLPQTELSKLGTSVSDDIKNVQGVSRVAVSGVPAREVDVIVKKEALEQYGLSLTSVIQAIGASNAALPAGQISMDGVNYTVNFKGNIDNPSEIQDITVGNKNNVPIYLRDIATISDGLAPVSTYSRVSIAGKPSAQALTFVIFKQSGGNIQAITSAVEAKFKDLQKTTLVGSEILIPPSTDQGSQVSKQLGDLSKTGLETVLLVIVALLITIGWRESLVAALSIPLSFLIAFIGLYLTGNSLNFISLFALILAVGILVDSGIVVTEAIHARMRIYPTKMEAAHAALHDYAWPLIAGTMATVGVFVPLFFISGIVGKFIAGIPYTLIFVLIASIFVALGIVPLIAVLFTKRGNNRLEEKQEEYTHLATEWYKKTLHRILLNRRAQNIFIWTLAGLFVASIILPFTGLVGSVFFPQDDQDFVIIAITKPQGTTLSNTDLATREVEEILYSEKDIASFQTTVGMSSDLSGTGSTGSNVSNITVNLPPGHKKSSTEVMQDLQKKLAVVTDADIQVQQANNGPEAGAPIQIQFEGDNLNDLIAATDKAKQLLSTIPHVTNISATTQNNGTEFDLTIDRAKATALGLNTMMVAQTLRAAVQGTKATSINQPEQNIDVVVKLNLNTAYADPSDTTRTTIDSIKNISIQGQSGPVLLGSVLSDSLGQSNAAITHKNKKRIETLSAYPDDKTTATAVTALFEKRIGELNLPAGVDVSYGGENQSINQSFSDLGVALLASLVLMFMVLIVAFNSIRYTLYLLLIVPLSCIGVLDGLALSGQPISFTSFLGIIALGGVIINHAIILMDSMIHHLRAEPNKPIIDTVVDSAATRLRPIFLTTITTVIGMIPLATSQPSWAPFAISIMFGLSFAIILTLVLVPVLFFRTPHKKAVEL